MAAEFDARGRLELIGDGEWAAADLSVRADGEPGLSFRLRPPAQLRMDDGSVVALDLAAAALLGGVEETSRGRWPELEKGPLGIAARDYRPGPHVPLVVKLRGVRSGALVTVRGAERVRSSAQGSSYREAELERRVEVREIDARGRRPEPRAETPARVDPGSIVWGIGLVSIVVCASVLWWIGLGTRDTATIWAAAACAAFGGTLAWRVSARWWGYWHFDRRAPTYRWLPEPRWIERGAPHTRVHYGIISIPALVAVPVLMLVVAGTLRVVIGPLSASKGAGVLSLAGILALAATLALLIEDRVSSRAARRFARALATASPASGWTVASGALTGALTRAVSTVTRVKGIGRGRTTTITITDAITAPDRIAVGGTPIVSRGVDWAAAQLERDRVDGDPHAEHHAFRYAAPESSAAIAAWAGDPKAEAWEVTGPGSLLLFTSATDPRGVLRRALLVQSLGPVPLLLSIAAALLAS